MDLKNFSNFSCQKIPLLLFFLSGHFEDTPKLWYDLWTHFSYPAIIQKDFFDEKIVSFPGNTYQTVMSVTHIFVILYN